MKLTQNGKLQFDLELLPGIVNIQNKFVKPVLEDYINEAKLCFYYDNDLPSYVLVVD